MTGRITLFNASRKYGFIFSDGKDYFFHESNFKGTPALSAKVTFDIGAPLKEGKAPQAINVRIVGGAA